MFYLEKEERKIWACSCWEKVTLYWLINSDMINPKRFGHVHLVYHFTIPLKCEIMALFCIFCWRHQNISRNLDTQFKCTSKISLSEHVLDKWPHFFIYYLNSIQGLFYKVRACMWFFRKRTKNIIKGQKGAKYLKIWAKMYKIWKYFEKGQVIACNYRMQ